MKSKKALFSWLASQPTLKTYGQKVDLKYKGISDETYGKTSCIYIWDTPRTLGMSRKDAEIMLINAGFRVNRKYWPESDAIELVVSYFKGWHWDE